MEKKVLVVLRSYAKDEQLVDAKVRRVKLCAEAVRRAAEAMDVCVRASVLVTVPEWPGCDCGFTADALRQAGLDALGVRGNANAACLNAALDVAKYGDVEYMLVVSNKAETAISAVRLETMLKLAEDANCRAAALHLPENDGAGVMPFMNTCSIWHVPTLRAVGGFVDTNGPDEESLRKGGCEEVIPLGQMVRLGLHPAVVVDADTDVTVCLDQNTLEHHKQVIEGKASRQAHAAGMIGMDLTTISGALQVVRVR